VPAQELRAENKVSKNVKDKPLHHAVTDKLAQQIDKDRYPFDKRSDQFASCMRGLVGRLVDKRPDRTYDP